MGAVRKFLFDESFDGPVSPARGAAAPTEPGITRAELTAAEARGREEGRSEGEASARQSQEAQVAAALGAIAEALARLIPSDEAARQAADRAAIGLARTLLGKL